MTSAITGASPSGSGLLANGSAFGNPTAPQGLQAAFVQEYGSLSQTLSGFIPGTKYTLSYSAAQRSGSSQNGGESWNVLINNTVIQANSPGTTSYATYSASFTASATAQTLTFQGTDLNGGDNTVFLDNVSFSPTIQPASASVALTSPANGTGFAAPATLQLAATVTTNGNLVNNVQFYANATSLIGQTTTVPYVCNWTNLSAGSYSVLARVNFNGGQYAQSAAATVIVTNPPPVVQTIGLTPGGFYLSGPGQAGQSYVLWTTPSLNPPVSWTPVLTNQPGTGGWFDFTNLPTTNAQQFFRLSAP